MIYVPGYYGEVGVIAKQAKQLDIKAPLLGGDGWDSTQLWDLGGDALNGDYISNHYSVDDPSPAIQKFVADYKARHGNVPDALAVTNLAPRLRLGVRPLIARERKRRTTGSEKLSRGRRPAGQ